MKHTCMKWGIICLLALLLWGHIAMASGSTIADTAKINRLNTQSFDLIKKDTLKAYALAKSALELSEKINYLHGIGDAYTRFGLLDKNAGRLNEAIVNYKQSLRYRSADHDSIGIAKCYTNLGNAYNEKEMVDSAIYYQLLALRINELVAEAGVIVDNYNNLGLSYKNNGDYELARKYLLSGYQTAKTTKDLEEKRLARICNNLANVYYEEGLQSEHAKPYLLETISLADSISDDLLADAANTLGLILMEQEPAPRDSVLYYFQYAYAIYKAAGSTELAAVTSNLGDFYARINNNDLAIRYLLESNEICNEQELKTQLITNYKLLGAVYLRQGRTADAYDCAAKALALNEEVYTIEKTEKIAELQLAYETEKKDRIIAEEKATSATQASLIARQRFLGSLLAGSAIVIIGSILFYARQRQLKRKIEFEQKLADDRLRISADLHDEIGSALSSIGVYSEVLKNTLQASDYTSAINYGSEIASTSRELMDNMSDLVWAVNPRNDSFEQLTSRLSNFGYKIFGAGNTNFKVDVTGDIPAKEVPMAVRHQIYMILKEALNNSAKYAQAKNVLLSINYKPDNISITVSDDGRGFDITNAQNGNGLHNMRRRAENMDARFDITSGNAGTQLTLNIPIP